eukprot:3629743-Pyramimonas_sp.AAC.1
MAPSQNECPVGGSNTLKGECPATASGTPPSALFTKLASSVGTPERAGGVGECPMKDTAQLDPKNNMFYSKQIQTASPDQR